MRIMLELERPVERAPNKNTHRFVSSSRLVSPFSPFDQNSRREPNLPFLKPSKHPPNSPLPIQLILQQKSLDVLLHDESPTFFVGEVDSIWVRAKVERGKRT